MQDLISQLERLYLLDGQLCFDGDDPAGTLPVPLSRVRLEQHLLGVHTVSLALLSPAAPATAAAAGRAIVLDFCAGGSQGGPMQWRALCAMANGLRDTLGLAAPAVSISGHGFQLWLSLERAQGAARIAEFAGLLRRAFLADEPANGMLASIATLPPARLAGGKWSAFIHPGMGASFAEEPCLEMAPPVGAQVGFLEGLASITPAQFEDALLALRARVGHDMQNAATPAAPAPPAGAAQANAHVHVHGEGLLLRDASLDDIVRHLHALHIEPTFRYLLPPG